MSYKKSEIAVVTHLLLKSHHLAMHKLCSAQPMAWPGDWAAMNVSAVYRGVCKIILCIVGPFIKTAENEIFIC
jgi:hypothetical protein